MQEHDQLSLTIGWLYPELMSTYGDRGNIMVLTKRCEWRHINVSILPIDFQTTEDELRECNLIIGGGAQDRQQTIVINDLRMRKGPVLKELFESGIPGLFVCGSPQLLGHFYMNGDGETLNGLGIFDMETKHFGKNKPRCIGNLIANLHEDVYEKVTHMSTFGSQNSKSKVLDTDDTSLPKLQPTTYNRQPIPQTIVGFENHGGRTYLGEGVLPFARVIKGYGNNGEDGTEGAIYNNCIATYSHGPFLSKNPHIADWLLSMSLQKKYDIAIAQDILDDAFAWKAHDQMIERRAS